MSKKEKVLIILLTIIIAVITIFTIFILINKNNRRNNIEGTYDQDKEEIIDVAGNITTIPSKNYYIIKTIYRKTIYHSYYIICRKNPTRFLHF